MTSVGFSRRMSSTDFMCQQSPNFGRLPTGATSTHHLVTPTKKRLAPMAHKMEVALGASETMRNGDWWLCCASMLHCLPYFSEATRAHPSHRCKPGPAILHIRADFVLACQVRSCSVSRDD